jgi:NAD(P)-dependent dehydrogenase (short-subunit alcohol dehydrogenase family)
MAGKSTLVAFFSGADFFKVVSAACARGRESPYLRTPGQRLRKRRADIMQTTQGKIETHPLDVAKVEQIETIPRTVRDKLGRIDLVNNAGTGIHKPFLKVTDEELVYGMAINFFAQFRFCQRIVSIMIAQGGGRIVNVSGETGIMTLNAPFLSSCNGPAKSAAALQGSRQRTRAAQYSRQLRDTGLCQYARTLCQWEREFAERPLSPEWRRASDRCGQVISAPAMRGGARQRRLPISSFLPSPMLKVTSTAQSWSRTCDGQILDNNPEGIMLKRNWKCE